MFPAKPGGLRACQDVSLSALDFPGLNVLNAYMSLLQTFQSCPAEQAREKATATC